MIRRVVYYLYSLKDVRNGILRGADSGNAKINALRYLFLIINGETAYSDSAIESSYRLLDSDESTRRFDDKNLFSLLEEISQRYIGENFMAVANISDDIAEDEEGDLDCKQLLCMDDFVKFPRKNSLLVSVCRDENTNNRHPHKLKNFETLTDDNGDKFDICFVNPDEKSRCYEVSMWYIKHDDGRWYRYGNDCVKQVDEHEVFEIGSFTDGDFVYSKRV